MKIFLMKSLIIKMIMKILIIKNDNENNSNIKTYK